jgi:hypothetical protein
MRVLPLLLVVAATAIALLGAHNAREPLLLALLPAVLLPYVLADRFLRR